MSRSSFALLLMAASVKAIDPNVSITKFTTTQASAFESSISTSMEVTGSGEDTALVAKMIQKARLVAEDIEKIVEGDALEMWSCAANELDSFPICTVWQISTQDTGNNIMEDTINMFVYKSRSLNIVRDTGTSLPSAQFKYLAALDDARFRAKSEYELINQVVYKNSEGTPTTGNDARYTGIFSIDAENTGIDGKLITGTRIGTTKGAIAIEKM